MPDLSLLRSDLGAFADAAGVPLTPWQVESLRLTTRISAIVGPRQSGKSRSLAVVALWWAFRSRGQRVLIVSAGEEASRRLLAEIRRAALDSPLLAGSVVDENAGLVTLSNGSEIRSVPASERQVRGWTTDLLLADEAGLIPDDLLLGAALPTTAARPNARIVLAGSAVTATGAFYDHVIRGEAGSEHVRSHRWALTDCEWISPTVIQAARDSMAETRFAAEYEGVFASGADALFTRDALDRVTADYYIPPLPELRGPVRVLAGCDWGVSHDRSALVAIARLPEAGERVFGVCCVKRWEAGAPLGGDRGVISDIVDSPVAFARITSELNGLGAPCSQELFRRLRDRPDTAGGAAPRNRRFLVDAEDLDKFLAGKFPLRHSVAKDGKPVRRPEFETVTCGVHTTAELKAATYSSLRMLIDREALLLPESATELRRELLLLRVDLSPVTGTERIEAGTGYDDLADALAFATGPYRRKGGGPWRTILTRLVDQAPDFEPESKAPTRGGHVRTGGGIELPRYTVFQSVSGPELGGQRAASGSQSG